MRLISVHVILDIEPEDLKPEDEILKEFGEDEIADRYAILSHCWGKANQEVKLKDMEDLPKLDSQARHCIQQRPGYQKIIETCKQARSDGFEWVWVDTCCINKDSSAELSEAINSMYRWYQNAGKCYAYLHDVQEMALPRSPNYERFKNTDGWPTWFSRGWTLQELIAPKEVHFFNAKWRQLENGTKMWLAAALSRITGIPIPILRYGLDADQPSTAQIMSWAAKRRTTRVEDRAYSLMGLFGIYMPMLYGEGKNAFRRLQLEIIRTTNDHSIFAWRENDTTYRGSVLADDPGPFATCGDVVRMEPEEYRRIIEDSIPEAEIPEERFQICSVTNGGIQIWLPIRQHGDQHTSEAGLACRNAAGPVCIQLVHADSQYHRTYAPLADMGRLHFQQLFLAYNHMVMQSMHFKLTAPKQGFVQENTHPFRDTSTGTISIRDSYCVVVPYFNQSTNAYFAVVLGSITGQPWAHLRVPRPGSSSEIKDFVVAVYSDMLDAGPKQVEAITRSGKLGQNYCHIKHLHLPRSISDIRLTLQSLPQPNTCSVTLDIIQCPGGCLPNDRWQSFDTAHVFEGCVLGNERMVLEKKISGTLSVDGIPTVFAKTLTDEVELGDYGHWNDHNKCFTWEGNIFKRSTTAFRPYLHLIEHDIRHELDFCNEDDFVKFYSDLELSLLRPRGLSLPNDERISDLLNALSTCLQGKCLITTVIQCSELYVGRFFDSDAWQNYGYSDDDLGWKSVSVSVPLFIPTQPLRWCCQGNSGETRAHFEEIRNQFSILSNALDPTSTDVKSAVNFFSDLFVGQFFQDYIGEIAFFRRVPSVQSARTKKRQSVESDKDCQGIQLQCPVASSDEWLGQVGMPCLRSRIESSTRKLAQRLPIGMDGSIDDDLRMQFSRDTQQSAWRVASKAFGAEVLQIIVTIYQRPLLLQQKSSDKDCDSLVSEHREQCDGDDENKEASYVDYDSIKLLIQEVETFQTQFNACDDEDERRAFEDDITGKILLACWRGVQRELKEILTVVVDRVVHDKGVDRSVQHARAAFLHDIGRTIRAVVQKFDDRDYLWRITTDAEAGISKHALLLASRHQARDVASSNASLENATMPTVMRRALQGATSSGTAPTDTMLVPDSSTAQVGMTRSREEETDAYEGD